MKYSIPALISSLIKLSILNSLVIFYPVYAATNTQSITQNWSIVEGFNPATRKQDCYMRSTDTTIRIGEDETRLFLLLTASKLYIVTNSIIDTSYTDSRINVDKYKPIPVTHFTDEKIAQIKTFDPDYLAQFIKGYWASVYMGYWPSWEKTGLQEARFNLVGFTRTYTEYIQCQARSEILTATGE